MSSNPKLLSAFVSEFAKEHKEDSYKIFSRAQLASILPGIPSEIGRKKPDLVLLGEKNLILIENKTGASLTKKQLGNYSAALSYDKNRKGSLLVIAPKSTRYVSHGHDIERITWDQIYTLIEKNIELINNDKREDTLTILPRQRYEFYQQIYDEVISRLSKSLSYSVSYHGQNPKDIYYSKHIILPSYPDITFSLGIFIKAPSYLLVNPFKIVIRGRKYDMNQGDPIVKSFKEQMVQLLHRDHISSSTPGYSIDLLPARDNTSERIAAEIKSILIDKSPDIQSILSKL